VEDYRTLTVSTTCQTGSGGGAPLKLSEGRGGLGPGLAKPHYEPLSARENARINSIGNGNTIVDCLSLAIVVRVVR
jgi:hypothetical protein